MSRVEELNPHTLSQLSEDLETMNRLVLKMGGLVEERLLQAIKALKQCDVDLAKTIAGSDYKVNTLEVEIDAECTKLLALHQLVACDLRLVTMALKMITDLERIGDEAQKIAKQVPIVNQGGFPQALLEEINKFGDKVSAIVHLALDSFARMEDRYKIIQQQDGEIDECCQSLIDRLLSEMAQDPENAKPLLSVVWCIRALERIGDHAKNIGEYTVYMLRGVDVRHVQET